MWDKSLQNFFTENYLKSKFSKINKSDINSYRKIKTLNIFLVDFALKLSL